MRNWPSSNINKGLYDILYILIWQNWWNYPKRQSLFARFCVPHNNNNFERVCFAIRAVDFVLTAFQVFSWIFSWFFSLLLAPLWMMFLLAIFFIPFWICVEHKWSDQKWFEQNSWFCWWLKARNWTRDNVPNTKMVEKNCSGRCGEKAIVVAGPRLICLFFLDECSLNFLDSVFLGRNLFSARCGSWLWFSLADLCLLVWIAACLSTYLVIFLKKFYVFEQKDSVHRKHGSLAY